MYIHPRHSVVPCQSGHDGTIAFSELYDERGEVLQRFEMPLAETPSGFDEFECVRRCEAQAIHRWQNRQQAEQHAALIKQQGTALLAAFEDEQVLDLLADKVAERLAARQQ